MNRTALFRSGVIAICLAAPLLADAKQDVDQLIRQMKAAAKAGDLDAAKSAFASAETYRQDAKSSKRLASAIGSCIKASQKKHVALAIAALDSLGKLQVPNSARQILPLLKAPKKVAYERVGLHLVAIRTAGKLHQAGSMSSLEKLLTHRSTDLAVAAANALGQYRVLEERPRTKLVERLVRMLNVYERKRATVKTHDRRNHYDKVAGNLIGCLADLTNNPVATTASDWTAWLKSEKKRKRALSTNAK